MRRTLIMASVTWERTFIEVNSIPTHIYSWGHRADLEITDKTISKLILVITGEFASENNIF